MNHNVTAKILVIDDESIIREIFSIFLEDRGFSVITAENGQQGIELYEKEKPDLVLTDLKMPIADGFQVLAYIKKHSLKTPVIVISGANNIEEAVKALRQGAWDYLLKPVQDLNLLVYTVNECLEKARLIEENQQYKNNLESLVEERTKELEHINQQLDISRRQIIGILSQAGEYRDFESGNHFMRVSEMAACIATGLGWEKKRVVNLQLAAPVHDIGKIGIPDKILLKEGKLNDSEWNIMKEHCIYGKNLLESTQLIGNKNIGLSHGINVSEASSYLMETAANIALSHHEYWDGTGYPLGIKGKAIPIEARITTVADVFDALRSKRPFKEPWSEKKSLTYIRERAGQQFDPDIIEIFFDNLDCIRDIQSRYQEI